MIHIREAIFQSVLNVADGPDVDRDRVVRILALPRANDEPHHTAEIEGAARIRQREDIIRTGQSKSTRLHRVPRGTRCVDQ